MGKFRWMINESTRIGLERNITSQQAFNSNMYHYLSDDAEFLKMYISRAIRVAKSKISDFRKTRKKNPNAKIPHYKKPHVIVDKQSYQIIGNALLIGVRLRPNASQGEAMKQSKDAKRIVMSQIDQP